MAATKTEIPITNLALARAFISDGRAREIRERFKLSIAEVAVELQKSPHVVRRWEDGTTRPRAQHALDYCALLFELVQLDPPEDDE